MAFRELMRAHAGMVLATAKRITRDAATAEDVVQETFLQLARQSQHVSESVAAWLHRVAWRRACNAVRDEATRRRCEEKAAEAAAIEEAAVDSSGEATWAEVEADLDAVINELPDTMRGPLVMHFLEGRSQRDIAKQLKLNQSTVSRTIETGLAQVRSRLKDKGVLCGAGLGVMISAHCASASTVPAALLTSLSKLGISGIGGSGAWGGAAAGAGAAGAAWWSLSTGLKLGAAALVVAVASVAVSHQRTASASPAVHTASASQPAASASLKSSIATEASKVAALKQQLLKAEAASPKPVAAKMPAHELVHSFPLPPRRPSGHVVRDAGGWIWGTAGAGGNYGLGLIYKMRPDGSEWQEVVSFNGIAGKPLGTYPRGGVMMAADGALWGTTLQGGAKNQGTLYRYDPHTEELVTMVEFHDVGSPFVVPALAPDGQLWGTTAGCVYRLNPVTHELATVFKFTGRTGAHPGERAQGELVADGLGFLWGVTEAGGADNCGVLYKINLASGESTTVVQFTGKDGASIGDGPIAGLTLASDGFLWGTTKSGGAADRGTVFKVNVSSGVFAAVAEFRGRADDDPGAGPETMLAADDAGHFWGTTCGGGASGHGTVFKLDAQTGRLSSVVSFTGLEGEVLGGPAHGHLFNDGSGGFIGACDNGGAVGTLFRVDIKTGRYSQLINICDLAKTAEGQDLRGTLAAGTGDWLWGVCGAGGAHLCGSVYKFNAVTNELVTVADLSGLTGPARGRYPIAGLVSDGQGSLWGTTFNGGAADLGTVFKIDEGTGAFTTVAECQQPWTGGLAAGPASTLVPDGKGGLWGTTFSTVYKIDMRTLATTTVATFTGDEGEHHGSGGLASLKLEASGGLGALALDDHGFIWGCSQADREHKRACLFKIDTTTGAFTTLSEFTDASPDWTGWHPTADMHWDGKGFMWFTGLIDGGDSGARCSLIKVNTSSGLIEGSYHQRGHDLIATPMVDANGVLWGGALNGGIGGNGSLYTFDTRSLQFTTRRVFTGQGSQAWTGQHPHMAGLMKHRDGNFYGITRVGGPGNGGTVYRLRFGPTPMTQEATLLADGSVLLHGSLKPNGFDSEAAFEWGTDPDLAQAATLDAGQVLAGVNARPVTASLTGLRAGTAYYFRLRGSNADNAIAQRGAVLSFVMPGTSANPSLAAHGTASAAEDSAPSSHATKSRTAAALSSSSGHVLSINRVPGAGAGFVKGALPGAVYQVGGRYSLKALADNDYIFHHWSGPGISGAQAENPELTFVFNKQLADSPMITATFVPNPFRDEAIGLFNGLVLAAEGVAPGIGTTGGLRLNVTRTGSFSGTLRYDGDAIPLAGAFDTGGLAKFADDGASPCTLVRPGKPALLLSLQLALNPEGSHTLTGTIAGLDNGQTAARSTIHAARSFYDGRQQPVPVQYLANGGGHVLTLTGGAREWSGLLLISPSGSASIATRLVDGTKVLAQAPISQAGQAEFFAQLSRGSFGGSFTLGSLLKKDEASGQPFWWGRPDQVWVDLLARSSQGAME